MAIEDSDLSINTADQDVIDMDFLQEELEMKPEEPEMKPEEPETNPEEPEMTPGEPEIKPEEPETKPEEPETKPVEPKEKRKKTRKPKPNRVKKTGINLTKREKTSPNPEEKTPSFVMPEMTPELMQAMGYNLNLVDATHVGQMDLRVGQIMMAYRHQSEDSLYIEEVDMGPNEETRLLATTLAESYKKESLKKKKIVVLCNAIPLDRREIMSKTGMALVARKQKEVIDGKGGIYDIELVEVPSDAEIGARVYVEGYANEPFETTDEEAFDFVIPDFRIASNGDVLYKDKLLLIEGSSGYCFVKTLTDCEVKLD